MHRYLLTITYKSGKRCIFQTKVLAKILEFWNIYKYLTCITIPINYNFKISPKVFYICLCYILFYDIDSIKGLNSILIR